MVGIIVISILAGPIYCVIPILILFEFYHCLIRQNDVKYPLLKGTIFGMIIGMVVAYLLSRDELGGRDMIGGVMAMIIFPLSIVLGIIIGIFYKHFDRPIFLRKKIHY